MQKLLIQSYKNSPKIHKFKFYIIHLLNGSYSKYFRFLFYFQKRRLQCAEVGHPPSPYWILYSAISASASVLEALRPVWSRLLSRGGGSKTTIGTSATTTISRGGMRFGGSAGPTRDVAGATGAVEWDTVQLLR